VLQPDREHDQVELLVVKLAILGLVADEQALRAGELLDRLKETVAPDTQLADDLEIAEYLLFERTEGETDSWLPEEDEGLDGLGVTDLDAAPFAEPTPQTPYRRETPKVGRNEPCPCGSGKKYKKCCGA
jgi:preprotein translocase subunit SecA